MSAAAFALADAIRATFDARDRYDAHWMDCRSCGVGGRLCSEGQRLHTVYVRGKSRIEHV